jgi:hypothetical protein
MLNDNLCRDINNRKSYFQTNTDNTQEVRNMATSETIRLGVKYQLATPLTSFVAVEEREDQVDTAMTSVKVPSLTTEAKQDFELLDSLAARSELLQDIKPLKKASKHAHHTKKKERRSTLEACAPPPSARSSSSSPSSSISTMNDRLEDLSNTSLEFKESYCSIRSIPLSSFLERRFSAMNFSDADDWDEAEDLQQNFDFEELPRKEQIEKEKRSQEERARKEAEVKSQSGL